MEILLEAITLASLGLVCIHLVGYPAFVVLLARLRPRPAAAADVTPSVTIVTAAFNEEMVILRKIESLRAQDYPRDHLEIVVVSDGSTDRTADIARRYADVGLRVVELAERKGKPNAINIAVAESSSEIVVVSDANAFAAADALRALVRYFADPEVGVVSGRVAPEPSAAGRSPIATSEGLYWRYEDAIKKAESAVASTTGVVGSLLAVRRTAIATIPADIVNDDSFLMLAAVRQGFRSIYAPEARCWRYSSRTMADDYRRRQRMSAGRFQHLLKPSSWPFNAPLTAFCLFCHKFLRLMLPWLLLGALTANIALLAIAAPGWLFLATLAIQGAMYGLAFIGLLATCIGLRPKLPLLAYYVVAGNIGILAGFFRHLAGRQGVLWAKAQR